MTTPTTPVVLPDGRIQIGAAVLTLAEWDAAQTLVAQHRATMEQAAAEREGMAKAVVLLARGLRAGMPFPESFGTTNRSTVQATMPRASDVNDWAAHLETTASRVTSQDGTRTRREAKVGSLVVATAWAAVTP